MYTAIYYVWELTALYRSRGKQGHLTEETEEREMAWADNIIIPEPLGFSITRFKVLGKWDDRPHRCTGICLVQTARKYLQYVGLANGWRKDGKKVFF